MYLEFTLSESMEQFLACHRHAFEFFRRVPAQGHDRQPQGRGPAPSLRDKGRCSIRATWISPPITASSRSPATCARANEKGRVENGVGYVKKNFLAGLDIASFAAVNPAASTGSTRSPTSASTAKPTANRIELFAEEKPRLKPLPVLPYDCAVVRPISSQRLLPRRLRHQPLLRAPPLRVAKTHPQALSRSAAALSPRKAHRHSCPQLRSAADRSAIPTTSRNC